MKFLYILPFILFYWTSLIFAHEDYIKGSYVGIIVSLILLGIFGNIITNKYKNIQKKKKNNVINSIALNIGLLPLLYSNLVLTPMVLQGKAINESGMIYVLVLIYSPIFYTGALIPLILYSNWKKKRTIHD